MKKVILFTVLALLNTAIASAQSYREYEIPDGKRYVLNHKNGKSAVLDYDNTDGKFSTELLFSGDEYKKETITESQKGLILGKNDHHLTINFDESMSNGTVLITSDVNSFSDDNMNWSNGYLTGEMDIPEGTYDIFSKHSYHLVFICKLEITKDVDTTINFEQMATNHMALEFLDENGNLIDPDDPALLFTGAFLIIEFPETLCVNSYLTMCSFGDEWYFSDLSTRFGYKIFSNQYFYQAGKMNIVDFGEFDSISADTLIQNDVSDYKNIRMVMNESPTAISDYLCVGYGYRIGQGGSWMTGITYHQSAVDPSFDKDTMQVFMTNRVHEYTNYSLTFIPVVEFWENTPPSDDYRIRTEPFFVNTNDSIVFADFNISEASLVYPSGSIIDIGGTSPYFSPILGNNTVGTNAIYGRILSFGQFNEWRDMDLIHCPFEIKKDEILVGSGNLYDDFNYHFFPVEETGEYTISVSNENYTFKELQGCTFLECIIDFNNVDRDPPVVTSFMLLDKNDFVRNSFEFNETASLQFSAFDYAGSTNLFNAPASVEVFFKEYYDTTWASLEVVEHLAWYDKVQYGYFYTCDLAGALSQFTGSGYLDIKIVVLDDAGNTTAQTFHPAAYVVNNTQYENDMALTNIISPVTGEDLGIENVTVRIKNMGTISQTNIPVHFKVDDDEMVSEIVVETILPGDSIDYTFSVQVDLSEYNTIFDVQACADLADDENLNNDCQYVEITNNVFPKISIDPVSIEHTKMPNTITTLPLNIENNGNVSLCYNIKLGDENNSTGLCTESLYTTGCIVGDGLVYWELANVSTNIECSGDPSWYHDFTDITHYLLPGELYTLTVKAGGFFGNTYFDVWLDFNDDFELTNDEIIIDNGFLASANTNYSFDISIPSDAIPGSHVMRIRSNLMTPVSDPCGTYGIGNCCDFTAFIGTDWITVDILSGVIEPGQSQEIILTFNTNDLEIGTYEKTISIASNDPNNPTIEVPVTLNLITQPWTFTVTGQAHTINLPSTANPNIFGQPLVEGDWVGVFFLDGEGNELCGGAAQIDATGGAVVTAYGNDPTTPEKDGFASGEQFKWKIYDTSEGLEYSAGATYDASMPNQGNFADFGLSKLMSLEVMYCQNYTFSQGWNGISSYILPFDADVETLFAPINDQITIMRNLTSIYWPGENVNTIGNFDNTSGYALKVTDNVGMDICGIESANRELTLTPGWHYLPVLSECDVNTMDLFGDHLSDIIIVQDLIGVNIFWPEMEIYSLENLEPGKAYKIKVVNEFTFTFPECNSKSIASLTKQLNSLSTPWGDLKMTPAAQVTAVLHSALTAFIEGDVMGAFGQNDQLYGYMTFNGQGQNQAITLFGDDATSADQEGFADGETVSYKLFRTSTGETFDLEAEYDQMMENSSGKYQSGSMAAIKNIVMKSNGTGTLSSGNIEIYPNPAHDELSIKINNMESGLVSLSIFDSRGQKITDKTFSNKIDLNVSTFSGGVYYLKLQTSEINEVRKIVIK